MSEQLIGYFTTLSKSSKPKTRYFILDIGNESLHYFKEPSQFNMLIAGSESIQDMLAVLDSKTLPLHSFKLSPTQNNSFTVTPKAPPAQPLTVFTLEKTEISLLYEGFAILKDRQNSGRSSTSEDSIVTLTLPNGHVYTGEVNDSGVPHGDSGKEFCENGRVYYGSFREGKWHGPGCIISETAEPSYAEYIDGEQCGI